MARDFDIAKRRQMSSEIGGVIYMWRLKGCPRCGGDMCIERSRDGWEEHCLQCSSIREYERIPALEREATLVAVGTNTSGSLSNEH